MYSELTIISDTRTTSLTLFQCLFVNFELIQQIKLILLMDLYVIRSYITSLFSFFNSRSSRSQMVFKISVLKFCKFRWKTPVFESLFNKAAGLKVNTSGDCFCNSLTTNVTIIETSQSVCYANQLNGFYRRILVIINRLISTNY